MTPYLIANWKSYRTESESVRLAKALRPSGRNTAVHLVICPMPQALPGVADVLRGSAIALGAQNVADTKDAAKHLKALRCRYVIVGHSSVRQKGENDALVAGKLKAVAAAGGTPILCVGEPLSVRRKGKAAQFIRAQIAKDLKGWRGEKLLIAYEPIWAIQGASFHGHCDPKDAFAMAEVITQSTKAKRGSIHLLYGGSVSGWSIASYVDRTHFIGALVGKASTTIGGFRRMVSALS